MFNICIVKPENYVHSLAFLELGELVYFSLIDLGIGASLSFNKIEPRHVNIIIGCHLLDSAVIQQMPKSTIILNTEQLSAEAENWNKVIFTWANTFKVWDYSNKNIKRFNDSGIDNVRHLKIGYQKELVRLDQEQSKDIDILFYGSINQRRKKILDDISDSGLNIKTLFGVYGKERDRWIERSRVVLNHHFYEAEIFEIVRVFYLMTNSVAVVAEVNDTTSIDTLYKDGVAHAKYDELVKKCIELSLSNVMRLELQQSALALISKYPQRTFTEEVIS